MSAATLAPGHDALLPRPPGGTVPGVVLALLVHAALAAALTVSVDWRVKPPDAVSAELWASVPQIAAPAPETPATATAPTPTPAPTPPAPVPTPVPAPTPAPPPVRAAPAPVEPDIAIQRAERRRADAERKRIEAETETTRKKTEAERKRAEEERKKREQAEQAAAAEREAKAEEERLARQREENLRRMMSQAGTGPATSTGTAAQSAAPSAAYTGKLVALIRGNLVFTGSTPDNSAAEVEVSAAANGSVIARRLVKSSGHKDWDAAVLRAIDRTTTLPRDADGRVPQRLIIAFRPRE